MDVDNSTSPAWLIWIFFDLFVDLLTTDFNNLENVLLVFELKLMLIIIFEFKLSCVFEEWYIKIR
jgi:hypothetical protein